MVGLSVTGMAWQVTAALRAIHVDAVSRDQRGIKYTGSDAVKLQDLDGRWRMHLTSHQEAIDFAISKDVW
jgi:hypothetical protein